MLHSDQQSVYLISKNFVSCLPFICLITLLFPPFPSCSSTSSFEWILKMFLKYSHNFPNNLLKFKQCDHESKETKRKNIANKNSNNNGSVDIKNKILQFSLNHIVYVRDFTFFSLVSSVNDDTIRVNIWFIIEYINRFEFSNAKKLHAIRANKRFK